MKKTVLGLFLSSIFMVSPVMADSYKIDKEGQHAFIQFKISHLGYSYLLGEFTDFDGSFTFDEDNMDKNSVSVEIKTKSIDSNHAERDKHLRGDDFFDVDKYPIATFKSVSFSKAQGDRYSLSGDLTIKGITQPVDMIVLKVGEGEDPWGGYRAGFEGFTQIKLSSYGMDGALGDLPVDIYISVEGIKQ